VFVCPVDLPTASLAKARAAVALQLDLLSPLPAAEVVSSLVMLCPVEGGLTRFALGIARSEYDDLSARLRRADEQRMEFERSLQPLRDAITKLQLEEQAAQLGGAQYMEQLAAAEVDLEALAKNIEENGVKLYGLQGDIDAVFGGWGFDRLIHHGRAVTALLQRRNPLGLLSEDIDPVSGQLWGNFPQTYSMVGIINSALRLSRSWEDAL